MLGQQLLTREKRQPANQRETDGQFPFLPLPFPPPAPALASPPLCPYLPPLRLPLPSPLEGDLLGGDSDRRNGGWRWPRLISGLEGAAILGKRGEFTPAEVCASSEQAPLQLLQVWVALDSLLWTTHLDPSDEPGEGAELHP